MVNESKNGFEVVSGPHKQITDLVCGEGCVFQVSTHGHMLLSLLIINQI